MWEAYGKKDEAFLNAGTAFRGGIAGFQEGPCGALSGGTLALGLRQRLSSDEQESAAAREAVYQEAAALAGDFKEKFGSITCIGLLGIDLSDAAGMQKARDMGVFENKCPNHVRYVIEKLYELESRRAG